MSILHSECVGTKRNTAAEVPFWQGGQTRRGLEAGQEEQGREEKKSRGQRPLALRLKQDFQIGLKTLVERIFMESMS